MNVLSRPLVVVLCVAMAGVSCARPRPKTATKPRISTPSATAKPEPAKPTELRGVWVSDTARLDWQTATADLQRAGFNAMFVNFASGGAAFYPSTVLPNVSGSPTDTLGPGIALAHKRGLYVYAKFIVTFMFKAPAAFQKQLIAEGRVMRGADRQPILQSGNAWLCPSHAANRALAVDVMREILSRYRINGVQYDYIRFNENPSCFCAHCRQEFEQSIGKKLNHWPADVLTGAEVARFGQWRVQLINAWVRDLTAVVHTLRPGLPVTAAVFPEIVRAREEKGQDWKSWLDRRQVDYVCTMNYTPDLREFDERNRQTQSIAGRQRVLVGIGSWKFEQMPALLAQIDSVRRSGAPGFILFSYDDAAARDFLPMVRTR